MDFTFSEEHDILRDSVRRFVTDHLPADFLRKVVDGRDRLDETIWSKFVELGFNGILIPEEYGGLGLTFVELGVILEELGKAAAPGPFISTVVLAGEAVRLAGNESQKKDILPKIASGELKATLAWAEPRALYDANRLESRFSFDNSEIVLNGTKIFVNDADESDLILCAASGPHGNAIVAVDIPCRGVTINRLETMDRTTSLCDVIFDEVRLSSATVLSAELKTAPVFREVFNRINVAYALDMVGGARRVLDMGVDYAKIRTQFDRVIGSFQAVKHRFADLLTDVEGARSLAYYAAWTQDNDPDQASICSSAAKAFSSDSYYRSAADVIQILGGIGFSWESEAHAYLKRARCLGALFGNATFHRERLAKSLGY